VSAQEVQAAAHDRTNRVVLNGCETDEAPLGMAFSSPNMATGTAALVGAEGLRADRFPAHTAPAAYNDALLKLARRNRRTPAPPRPDCSKTYCKAIYVMCMNRYNDERLCGSIYDDCRNKFTDSAHLTMPFQKYDQLTWNAGSPTALLQTTKQHHRKVTNEAKPGWFLLGSK
jgi:hypothetical protein